VVGGECGPTMKRFLAESVFPVFSSLHNPSLYEKSLLENQIHVRSTIIDPRRRYVTRVSQLHTFWRTMTPLSVEISTRAICSSRYLLFEKIYRNNALQFISRDPDESNMLESLSIGQKIYRNNALQFISRDPDESNNMLESLSIAREIYRSNALQFIHAFLWSP
jgi:hypothetical protein